MTIRKIRIGTRTSKLALKQADEFKSAIISKYPIYKNNIEIIKINTSGDKMSKTGFGDLNVKDLFTKEIEQALLDNEIDMAIHSVKDLPAEILDGLIIAAILPRQDPGDAFISYKYKTINDLPDGSIIGTSALRRKAAVRNYNNKIKVVDYHGNIEGRIKRLDNSNIDGIILAKAGLNRINREDIINHDIAYDIMLPAVGQGAICAQIRIDDEQIKEILSQLNDDESSICINAERKFMYEIDGSCKTPMACYAYIENDLMIIKAQIFNPSGTSKYTSNVSGNINQWEQLAVNLADDIKLRASEILMSIKDEAK